MKPSEEKLRKELGLEIAGAGRINYSVKAGAGGGKTTMFSIRICAQILEGIPINNFVIITYTNAAAAELREKVTRRLGELLANGKLSDTERVYAQEALNNIELIQISTIHAFLLKILKEYAFETGIVLDAQMLEDDDDQLRREKFFNEWYRVHYNEIDAYSDDWTITVESTNKEKDVTRQVFFNMFTNLANIREDVVIDTSDHTADFECAAQKYVSAWLPKLVIFKNELIANRPLKKDGTAKALNKTPQSIVDDICEVEGKTAFGIEDAVCLSKAIKNIKDIVDKEQSFYGASCDNTPIIGVIPTIPKWELDWNFQKLYEEFMLPSRKVSRTAEYVCRMQKEYQKQIDSETLVLSNDDILYRAEKLLSEKPEILNKLRASYSKIYVDEFQDTTGRQTRIVKMLSEKVGTDPKDNELETDKLLIVGDPKQSIYRFTGAEKAVYDDMDNMLNIIPDTEAMSVSLDTNFRSNSDIVKWVNDTFSVLMPGTYSPMDTDWNVYEKEALHGVFRYESTSHDKASDIDAVAMLVQKLICNDRFFVEDFNRDDNSYSLRKIRYSDIMILSKNTTNMKGYVAKFAELGIPVNVQGKFQVNDDDILKNFVDLVEYFANTKNKKSRILATQVLKGFDANRVDESEIKAAEDELRSIRTYFKEASLDSAAKLQFLLARENLYIPKRDSIKVERVREYRIRLHQMVEACLLRTDGDLKVLCTSLRKYLETDVKREIPLDSNENAICLMNAHQAKGLTGQIVIIADRTADENCRYGGFRKAGRYYPAASYKHREESSSVIRPSYGFDMDILRQVYIDETDEAIRLQYVAATRAAHALIIMPVASSRTTPWFTDSAFKYEQQRDIVQWIKDREADSKVYQFAKLKTDEIHPVKTLDDLANNANKADYNAMSDKQLISITPSGLELSGVTGFSPKDPEFVKENRPSANVFGTVMHRVYELLVIRYQTISSLSLSEKEKLIERLINLAILEQKENLRFEDKPQEFVDYLKPIMVDYLDKVIKPIMDSAEEVYPEYTFSFYVQDKDKADFIKVFEPYLSYANKDITVTSGTVWINGQADLVVKQKDGTIKVYDYKSDAMNGKAKADFEKCLVEKYAGQLLLYRYAIGKSFNVNSVDVELVHLYR